jgi:hypothetical protein
LDPAKGNAFDAGCEADARAGIALNEHIVEDSLIVFAHACRLGAEGIVSKKVDGTYRSGPCRVWINVRNPASGRDAAGAQRDVEPMSPRQPEDRSLMALR